MIEEVNFAGRSNREAGEAVLDCGLDLEHDAVLGNSVKESNDITIRI